MTNKRDLQAEKDELVQGAQCLRVHGDAILDGTHAVKDLSDQYGYMLLALAGWVEAQSRVLNLESRQYALAVVRSFVFGPGEVL